jgi:hypothetical protein
MEFKATKKLKKKIGIYIAKPNGLSSHCLRDFSFYAFIGTYLFYSTNSFHHHDSARESKRVINNFKFIKMTPGSL